MKIGERYFDQDGKLIKQATYDPNPLLRDVQHLRHQREAGGKQISDGKHVARFPRWMVSELARRRGIREDDTEGMDQLIQEMVLSRDLSHYRIWDGSPF